MRQRTCYEPEHEQFRESVRRFVEREILPYDLDWREAGKAPRSVWLKAGEAGLHCPTVPEEYGGVGVDYRYHCIVHEEIRSTSVSGFLVHSDIVPPYLLHFGSEEQKQKYLPQMVTGENIFAIAMTEPDAGSDLQAMRTRAVRDGDEYVISGQKTYISNGQNCDTVLLACKTDPTLGARGISLILVEADRPGFQRGRNLDKIGQPGADTSELFFHEVRVPVSNLLGQEGRGFGYMMNELPQERLALAMIGVASAQRAFDVTLQYVKERKAFKQRVFDFQNTRFKLAEMRAKLEAAWAYADDAIVRHVKGELTAAEGAMIKYTMTELQVWMVNECLQLHGGFGYMNESEIGRLYVDARIQTIHGGTSEIMKEIIGRSLDA